MYVMYIHYCIEMAHTGYMTVTWLDLSISSILQVSIPGLSSTRQAEPVQDLFTPDGEENPVLVTLLSSMKVWFH